MNARFLAGGAIIGFVVAAAVLTGQSAAQVEGEKGVFSTLKIGQMVQVRQDPVGIVITSYDDPAFKTVMTSKIIEIGHDYIAVDFQASDDSGRMEVRYPVDSIAAVTQVKKKVDSKTGPKKKPG